MLTKDSVTVSVDAVVYYRVSNATVSVANVENAHHSTRLLAQTTLRNILGTKNLHEILSDRESISGSMQVSLVMLLIHFKQIFERHPSSLQTNLDEATTAWGIKVERVEMYVVVFKELDHILTDASLSKRVYIQKILTVKMPHES